MARLHLHRQRSVLLRTRGVLTIYRKPDCLIHQSAPQQTKNRCIIEMNEEEIINAFADVYRMFQSMYREHDADLRLI